MCRPEAEERVLRVPGAPVGPWASCVSAVQLPGQKGGQVSSPSGHHTGKKIILKSNKFTKIENNYSRVGGVLGAGQGAGQGRSSGLVTASSSRCSGRPLTTTSRKQPTKPVL